MKSAVRKRWRILSVFAVSVLGLFLRWYRPTLVEYGFDEALVSRLSLLIAYWHYRPLVGVQASIGPYQFPLFLYIAAFAVKVWASPLAIVYWIAFLNALAVPVTYVLGKRYWSPWVGVLAAFLFAVNAWSVAYARKIWTQNITLVTVLFFLMVYLTFVDKKPWAMVGAWVGVAALIGLHLEGLAFLILLLIFIVLWRQDVRVFPLFVGVLLFTLLLAPYFVHDAHQGWQNVRGFLTYSRGTAIVTLHAVDFAFRLASGRDVHALAGLSVETYLAQVPSLWFLNVGMEIVLVGAMIYAVWRVWRGSRRERRAFAILLLWFWLPVALQLRHTRPVYPHYFTILYPSAFLLIAAFGIHGVLPALNRRCAHGFRIGYYIMLLALVVWGGWQIFTFEHMLSFVDTHPTPNGFGVPLKYPYLAAEKAKQVAGMGDIVVVAQDGELEWSVPHLQFDSLLFTHPVRRFVNGQHVVVVGASPTTYLITPPQGDSTPLAHMRDFLISLPSVHPVAHIPLPDGREYIIARSARSVDSLPEGFVPFRPHVVFQNGVRFLGYRVQSTPSDVIVWVAWEIPQPTKAFYHTFIHLVDEQGNKRAGADVSALLPYYQRAGDRVYARVVMPAQEKSLARLEVGMYEYPSLKRVPIVSPPSLIGRTAFSCFYTEGTPRSRPHGRNFCK